MASSCWNHPEKLPQFSGVSKGLTVNNSLTGTKTPFVPRHGNNVTWYMCGPTVYDVSHVGHARTYLTFDIIRRIMQDYFKYKVYLCMNITDVDDKIIKRAVERLEAEGKPLPENPDTTILTREMESLFWNDMAALNVQPPNVVTRVTEYMDEIVAFIQKIIDNGYAYESGGSVYFDTEAFDKEPNFTYGKLCPNMVGNEEALKEGEGALSNFGAEKRSSKDFVLWKKSKEKEPYWSSPWGKGRPGWHIECSAMAGDILGGNIDIHTGGIDLRFPHHTNELAQSEACFKCDQWINYFLHAGHLNIDGLKMSKSLKNFISIKAALEEVTADDFRMFYLTHKYDTPLDFGSNSLELAAKEVKAFHTFFQNMQSHLRNPVENLKGPQRWDECEKELQLRCEEITQGAHAALCDNFDTPKVIILLKQLITEINKYIAARQAMADSNIRVPLLQDAVAYISDTLQMFGMGPPKPVGIEATGAGGSEGVAPVAEVLCNFRAEVRANAIANKDKAILDLCDRVRNGDCPKVGVQIEDNKEGSTFKIRDPKELMEELAAAQKAEDDKKAAKEAAKAAQLAAKEEKAKKKAEQLERQKQKEKEKQEKAAAKAAGDAPKDA